MNKEQKMTETNRQFYRKPEYINNQGGTIQVVIAKPTRFCNADCSYCSSPPVENDDGSLPKWDIETFKFYFDKVFPHLASVSTWIWHGGEPMLMGPDFYRKAYEYAQRKCLEYNKTINFSMQSNMLGYNEKWHDIFANIFNGSVSSSFDPDEVNRTIKGNTELYSKVFKRSLSKMLEDGFRPLVIGVYSEETAHMMHDMYDYSISKGDKAFSVRFNYCTPSGRVDGQGELISPETYANNIIEVFNRWKKDLPEFTITPVDQMLTQVVNMSGTGGGQCPWTKSCGGRFIDIEPDGSVYNCSEFADIGKQYEFGNLNTHTMEEILNSKAIRQIKRRVVNVPQDCHGCEHFNECQGGCMRDSEIYNNGLYGKFYYCRSWKKIFTAIKVSIIDGSCDGVLRKYSLDPERVREGVIGKISANTGLSVTEIVNMVNENQVNPYGFMSNYVEDKKEDASNKRRKVIMLQKED